jgi:hypothetical protein
VDEILFPALMGSLATAGLSQYLTRVVVEFLRERLGRDPEQVRRTVRRALVSVAGLALLAGAAWAFYYFAEDIVGAALEALAAAGSRGPIVLVGMGLLAGVLLFLLRKYARIAYGTLEIILAVIGLAGYPATAATGGIPWLISLLALIYILVRGLDNVDVGIKEWKEKAPVAA